MRLHVPARLVRALGRSAAFAALLSFVFPGLGQLAAGSWRRAVVLALPPLALVVAVAGALIPALREDPWGVFGLAADPYLIVAVVFANLAVLAWRLLAIVDAYRVAARAAGEASGRGRRSGVGSATSTAVLSLALALTVGVHGGLAVVGLQTARDVSSIYVDDGIAGIEAALGVAASADAAALRLGGRSYRVEATSGGAVTPDAWNSDGRLDVLAIGCDYQTGRGRNCRTDAMMLVSIKAVSSGTAKSAFFSFPRNKNSVPLPAPYAKHFPNGRYNAFDGMLSSFWRWADERCPATDCPGTTGMYGTKGNRALARVIQHLSGVTVDGWVKMDILQFIDFFSALPDNGGVDINVPKAITDTAYPAEDGSGLITVSFRSGLQHLTGLRSLRYARVRHSDNDYCRSLRQQRVLEALRAGYGPNDFIPWSTWSSRLGRHLRTSLTSTQVQEMVSLIGRVPRYSTVNVVFSGTGYPTTMSSTQLAKMRSAIRNAFTTTTNHHPSGC